ncbi:CehA/McbA family metallohydrolase [Streptococcus uberis]|nr:CehA/McbA family metallohydrolase [Streptococcus uberis]MCK1202621.1 CehA/McbA family metallohydrolase [Streptococcus uberis]
MKETYHFQLDKDQQRLSKASFQMPEQCSGISLTYSLEEPYTMLVLLMIRDDKGRIRFQKQLSYSGKTISLSQESKTTTIGGLPGQLDPGEWTIEAIYNQEYGKHFDKEVIAFDIDLVFTESDVKESISGPIWVNEDFEYRYLDTIKKYQKGKRWYKGDFHTHTQLSDGKELIPTVTEKVLEEGLDFYIATEHNLLHTGWQKTPLMVLPGMEMTTNFGHANVFGLTKRPETLDDIIFKSGEKDVLKAIDAFIQECHDNDWLFSINHPFLYLWKWQFKDLELSRLNCLEIINDPTYELEPKAQGKLANQQAVALSDLFWSEGYRICAIGGSDSHMLKGECYPTAQTPSVPGDPATWILMDNLTAHDLKDGLKACHSYVTRFCSLDISLRSDYGDDIYFGDILPEQAHYLDFDIQIAIEDQPIFFYMMNDQKVVVPTEEIGAGLYRASGHILLEAEDYQWVRFGAETQDGDFRFYANPITKGHKTPELKTFGQAIKALGIDL